MSRISITKKEISSLLYLIAWKIVNKLQKRWMFVVFIKALLFDRRRSRDNVSSWMSVTFNLNDLYSLNRRFHDFWEDITDCCSFSFLNGISDQNKNSRNAQKRKIEANYFKSWKHNLK